MSDLSPPRTRTYAWFDQRMDMAEVAKLDGLSFMQAMLAGRFPKPAIADTLDFNLLEVAKGFARFEGLPGEFAYNPLGTVHGGYAATLLDSCLGCAVHTALPQGSAYTTVELKVNYIRAMTAKTGKVVAEGRLIHLGGRIATAEGRLLGAADGKLYAHGSTTCAVFPMQAAGAAA